jgi:hypothetical protein
VRRFIRHLHYWLRRRQLDVDLVEEIEAHRAMKQDELEHSGATPAEAADRSRRALGNVTLAREDARDVWTRPRLENVWRDVRVERQPIAEWYGQLIGNTTDLVVRTDRDPLALASTITDVVRSVDTHLMVISVTTVEDRMGTLTAPRRFQTWLLMLFAVVALTLATTGIYGIVRYSVSERTREIGVRMAFGADQHALVRLVTWESMRLPILGLSIGLAGASVATRLM